MLTVFSIEYFAIKNCVKGGADVFVDCLCEELKCLQSFLQAHRRQPELIILNKFFPDHINIPLDNQPYVSTVLPAYQEGFVENHLTVGSSEQ